MKVEYVTKRTITTTTTAIKNKKHRKSVFLPLLYPTSECILHLHQVKQHRQKKNKQIMQKKKSILHIK